MNPKTVGALIGLAIGVILILFGFYKALLVAIFVAIGWFIGKIIAGEFDIISLLERISGRRRE